MKGQESSKQQLVLTSIRKPSKFSVSCKFLFCAIFIIGVVLNIILTTILLFGVENYHKADPVKIYQIFESPKYAQTNELLDNTQYLILHGQPSSGIINFIEHEANLRTVEGKPVVLREIEQNIIHKHLKETKHFVEMYLGQVGRGQHSWFILLNDTETPTRQIESLQKRYPRDSIILVAHKRINIEGFTNHKFPSLKAKQLRDFMQKDLDICPKQVKQVFDIAASKQAPAIFQAYKSFEQSKARALEQAQRLRQQQQQAERIRLQQQARIAAQQAAHPQSQESKGKKKSKKDKSNAVKSRKGKGVHSQEKEEEREPQLQQEPEVQQQSPKKNKSNKKAKAIKTQTVVTESQKQLTKQQPKKKSKKSSKKSHKSQTIEEQVQQQLQQTPQQLPLQPQSQESQDQVNEEVAVVQQVQAVPQVEQEPEARGARKSKGKGRKKVQEKGKKNKKQKQSARTSTGNEQAASSEQQNADTQTASVPVEQAVLADTENDSTQETR